MGKEGFTRVKRSVSPAHWHFCAAGMYFLFLILSIVNIALDKRPLHLLLMLFCASEFSDQPAFIIPCILSAVFERLNAA